MSIYQRLLLYFLDSDRYFIDNVDWFLSTYEHFGECGKEQYPFQSEQFCKFKEKENADCGFNVSLSDKQIQLYFTLLEDELQLFSTVFAHWCGLTDEQIAQVKDRRHRRHAWRILNFFICNPNCRKYPKQNGLVYPQNYIVIKNDKRYAAERKDNILILCETGEKLEIV